MSGHKALRLTEPETQEIAAAPAAKDCCAVIVAAGTGTRFGGRTGKQFVELGRLPVVAWSVLAFDEAPSVDQIVLVCPPGGAQRMEDEVLSRIEAGTRIRIVEGGATRQESAYRGLAAVDSRLAYAAIHDGARPLVTAATIENALAHLRCRPELAGIVCAHPVTDTLKVVDGREVVGTPDRARYWAVQTPQVFRAQRILMYHEAAASEGFAGTDDASLAERFGGAIRCVMSPRSNIKITEPEDLAIAQALLEQRTGSWQDARRGRRRWSGR